MTTPADWQRAMKTFQASSKKAGPRALLTAIVGQAAADLAGGDRGAAAYFLSEQYKHHVSLLGFPADYLPVGVKAADLVALVEGQPSRPRQRRKMTQAVTV